MLTVSDNHIVLGGGGGGGGGDVVGAASSTDNAIAVFSGETGKLVKNSSVTISGTALVGANSLKTDKLALCGSYQLNSFWTSGVVIGADGQNKFLAGYSPNFFGGAALIAGASSSLNSFAPVVITGSSVTIGYADNAAALVVDGAGGVRTTALAPLKINSAFIDNAGSAGTDGQVLKKVGGLVKWSNP